MERDVITSQRRKIKRTTEQIKLLLSEYESSGLSAEAFCELHQIKRLYLTRWLKKYRKSKPPKGFVAVRTPKEEAPDHKGPALFAEFRGIRFYQPVDPIYLKTLLN